MDPSNLPAGSSAVRDYSQGAPNDSSPLSQTYRQTAMGRFNEDFDAVRPNTSYTEAGNQLNNTMQRSDSAMSQSNLGPSRGGTLKKKQSLRKSASFKRSNSRRSIGAGSVKSLALGEREKYADGHGEEIYSAFFTPIPTSGNPTEILANRFQAWRKVLKDLLTYFREIQKSYESRSKALIATSNVINNMTFPSMLLAEGGIGDALHTLRHYHKQATAEANKARSIEEEVIVQLSGLRSDLQQKIKEIKNLSGDFRNNVDKETEGTRRAVHDLQEALGLVDHASNATTGKGDPFIVKLAVDRQVEKQIDEENYLHRAFLNLENSGRELESIVVGEIQKAYNAYAGILKREADEAYETVDTLRNGPIAMPKDTEWDAFVHDNEHFVNPTLPVRKAYQIEYPGKNSPAAVEVRAGMLERKSKYLKSYTPGWYVLSPTHLHEFKSADRINYQSPVMSLYLPEQKLGSHSNTDSSSHKFMLKGRQTGSMHRGHGWVFRAESQDTMMAWYEDVKNLTEKTGEERNAFVRKHARSVSQGSKTGSVSSDGAMDEDEADQTPYSATTSQLDPVSPSEPPSSQRRPQPGGRFPSDLNVSRGLRVPLSPSSGTSSDDHDVIAAAGALPGSAVPFGQSGYQAEGEDQSRSKEVDGSQTQGNIRSEGYAPYGELPYQPGTNQVTSHHDQPSHGHDGRSAQPHGQFVSGQYPATVYDYQPVQSHNISSNGPGQVAYANNSNTQTMQATQQSTQSTTNTSQSLANTSDWTGPAAAGMGGAAIAIAATDAHHEHHASDFPPTAASAIDSSATQPHPAPFPVSVPAELSAAATPPATSSIPTASEPALATTSATSPAVITPLQNTDFRTYNSTDTNFMAEPEQTLKAGETEAGAGAVTPRARSVLGRPGIGRESTEQSVASATTISDLHIPGEYPRRTESGSS